MYKRQPLILPNPAIYRFVRYHRNSLQAAPADNLLRAEDVYKRQPITITPYDGLDPEVDGGMDRQVYPRPISVLFGVNINF